jgi:hypothetical protein
LSTSYTNNALNQVTGRGVPGYVDVTGAATATATSVTVNGQTVDHRKVEYYWKKLAVHSDLVSQKQVVVFEAVP